MNIIVRKEELSGTYYSSDGYIYWHEGKFAMRRKLIGRSPSKVPGRLWNEPAPEKMGWWAKAKIWWRAL